MSQNFSLDDLETVVQAIRQAQNLNIEITYMQISREGRNLGALTKGSSGWTFTPGENRLENTRPRIKQDTYPYTD